MTIQVTLVKSPQDFARFRDLTVEYEDSLPVDLRHPDFQRQLEGLEQHFGPPNAAFVATVDGVPGGCVGLTQLNASTGVIKKLYVRPAQRNLGLARKLLAAAIDRARSNGMARVVLDTERERLQAAYRLYLSLGFEECEPYGEVDYACPTFMQLQLG
jgi:GNAT superfamily N-acetyltransferase